MNLTKKAMISRLKLNGYLISNIEKKLKADDFYTIYLSAMGRIHRIKNYPVTNIKEDQFIRDIRKLVKIIYHLENSNDKFGIAYSIDTNFRNFGYDNPPHFTILCDNKSAAEFKGLKAAALVNAKQKLSKLDYLLKMRVNGLEK